MGDRRLFGDLIFRRGYFSARKRREGPSSCKGRCDVLFGSACILQRISTVTCAAHGSSRCLLLIGLFEKSFSVFFSHMETDLVEMRMIHHSTNPSMVLLLIPIMFLQCCPRSSMKDKSDYRASAQSNS